MGIPSTSALSFFSSSAGSVGVDGATSGVVLGVDVDGATSDVGAGVDVDALACKLFDKLLDKASVPETGFLSVELFDNLLNEASTGETGSGALLILASGDGFVAIQVP